jgi:hypothetical protein
MLLLAIAAQPLHIDTFITATPIALFADTLSAFRVYIALSLFRHMRTDHFF